MSTERRPRLLLLVQLPPPIHGVAVVNQAIIQSELLASRFDIEVLPLAFSASLQDLDRPSVRKVGKMIETCARLAHALVSRRPDAVYFTLSPTGGAFYRDCALVAIMKLLGVPRIYHLHGKGIRERIGAPWRRQLYRWVFRDAWVIHLAERLIADLESLVPRARVLVVPNGIAERSVPDRGDRAGGPRLLYLSNMIESKGPLVLVEALGLLRARGIEFEATFAGAEFNDGCLARFRERIRRLGLERQVQYMGPAYDEAKHRLLDEHDVFVFPTCNDAFPLVVLEAMQAGIPVVTTHEGAIPEIIEDGETGLLVPRRDPVALASCLEALLSDPGMQRRMGARARVRHEERYTLAAFERNLVAALETCTEAASAGSRASTRRWGRATSSIASQKASLHEG
ncbi:MAG TPA: glycosyltransferase family 4 protein [Kofleriaceae bacterium]|jgi:glycosyltransferase involved in cell wall biosynthesis|nr:glycosyltransferase family 4 protein [Kofleriaceae bacterium]